jgi:O-antigen ligase
MRWIAAIAALGLPLAIMPGVFFFDDVTPKAILLLILCGASLLIAAWNGSGMRMLLNARTGGTFLTLVGASILISLLSTLLSQNRELAWYGSNWRRLGGLEEIAVLALATTLAAGSAVSSSVLRWFLRGLCIAGSVAGTYAVFQYFGLDLLLPSAAYHAGEGPFRIVRPPGTLGHSDYLGIFLLWSLFAGMAAGISEQRRLWSISGWFAVAASAAGMVLSGSRAPLVGLIAGICVLLFFVRPKARLMLGCTAIAILCVGAFYASPAGARLRARVFWIGDEPLGGARLLLWRDTVSMTSERPLRGVGPENFIADFPRHQSVALSQAFPDFYHESPHNLVLDIFAAEGMGGLLALLALCACGVAAGFRLRRSNQRKTAGFITAAIAGAFAAHQFTVLTIPLAVCLFAAIGFLVSLNASGRAPAPNPRFRYLATAIAAAMVIGMATTAWRFGVTDHRLALARQHIERRQFAEAARMYELVAGGPPSTGSADLYFSRRWASAAAEAPDALSKMQFSRLANIAAVRATHDPEQRANALYNYAAFAAIRNDVPATEESLRAAIAVAPNWFKPHWTLARLLNETGRSQDAQLEAVRAAQLEGGKKPEVAETMRDIERRASLSP